MWQNPKNQIVTKLKIEKRRKSNCAKIKNSSMTELKNSTQNVTKLK